MSGKRIREERKKRKITLEGLAETTGLSAGFLSRIESGARGAKLEHLIRIARGLGVPLAVLRDGDGEGDIGDAGSRTVPIMGRVGAGAEISPEFEQVPEEGLGDVELPFPVPEEMVGFEVTGDSMMPKYSAGDVIVVYREERRSKESLIGEEAAVRTWDGRRFLKRIMPGKRLGTFNLESFNASPIESVRLAWAGEIWVIVPRGQIRRIEMRERRAVRQATKGRRPSAR